MSFAWLLPSLRGRKFKTDDIAVFGRNGREKRGVVETCHLFAVVGRLASGFPL